MRHSTTDDTLSSAASPFRDDEQETLQQSAGLLPPWAFLCWAAILAAPAAAMVAYMTGVLPMPSSPSGAIPVAAPAAIALRIIWPASTAATKPVRQRRKRCIQAVVLAWLGPAWVVLWTAYADIVRELMRTM